MSGAFKTVGDVIHDALISQDAEESWMQENHYVFRMSQDVEVKKE